MSTASSPTTQMAAVEKLKPTANGKEGASSQLVGNSEFVLINGTSMGQHVYPNPASSRLSQLEWQLRYEPESIEAKSLLLAASVISAYRAIAIERTIGERNMICSEMRTQAKAMQREQQQALWESLS